MDLSPILYLDLNYVSIVLNILKAPTCFKVSNKRIKLDYNKIYFPILFSSPLRYPPLIIIDYYYLQALVCRLHIKICNAHAYN